MKSKIRDIQLLLYLVSFHVNILLYYNLFSFEKAFPSNCSFSLSCFCLESEGWIFIFWNDIKLYFWYFPPNVIYYIYGFIYRVSIFNVLFNEVLFVKLISLWLNRFDYFFVLFPIWKLYHRLYMYFVWPTSKVVIWLDVNHILTFKRFFFRCRYFILYFSPLIFNNVWFFGFNQFILLD